MSTVQGKVCDSDRFNKKHGFLCGVMQCAVTSISKLKVLCPMCNEEVATVTMRPCGHEFCPGS